MAFHGLCVKPEHKQVQFSVAAYLPTETVRTANYLATSDLSFDLFFPLFQLLKLDFSLLTTFLK